MKMKMKNPPNYHNQNHHQIPHGHQYRFYSVVIANKLFIYALYALLPIAFLSFSFFNQYPSLNLPRYFSPSRSPHDHSFKPKSSASPPLHASSITSPSSFYSPFPTPSPPIPLTQQQQQQQRQLPISSRATVQQYHKSNTTPPKPQPHQPPCDYTDGEWLPTSTAPLYNGTTCASTIKDAQNCMAHGRPDLGYLHWRWQPKTCNLPPFSPTSFLTSLRNKHLAFVGDSMARNQLESLVCLLSSTSYPNQLIYSHGGGANTGDGDGDRIRFRRWRFPSHNTTVSAYWSPFLVKGVEKSSRDMYNRLFVDSVDERWAADLGEIDVVVLSIGHWYLLRAVYFQGKGEAGADDDKVLGCHACQGGDHGLNHTEIGFYGVFRKAYRTALNSIIESRSGSTSSNIDVVVTTFMPSHFEGEWDKAGACNRTRPYRQGEVEVEGINAQMRRIALEEVERARRKIMIDNTSEEKENVIRVHALDVTKLSLMRPDGHPGPYMFPFPFANRVLRDRVPNDCLHFCLPGPVDTWNEIMLEMIIKHRHQ